MTGQEATPDPLERALGALAAEARHGETAAPATVDNRAILAQVLADREQAETRRRAEERYAAAMPPLLCLALAVFVGALFWSPWLVVVTLAAIFAVFLLWVPARDEPAVTVAARRDVRVLAVACPRPGCEAPVQQRCSSGPLAFQHQERVDLYAKHRYRIEQREKL